MGHQNNKFSFIYYLHIYEISDNKYFIGILQTM